MAETPSTSNAGSLTAVAAIAIVVVSLTALIAYAGLSYITNTVTYGGMTVRHQHAHHTAANVNVERSATAPSVECVDVCGKGAPFTDAGGDVLSGNVTIVPVIDSKAQGYATTASALYQETSVAAAADQIILSSYTEVHISVLPTVPLPLNLGKHINFDTTTPGETVLEQAFLSGAIPSNAIPVILIPGSVNATTQKSNVCGIHLYTPSIYVSDNDTDCPGGVPSTVSHELAETVTNPNGHGWAAWDSAGKGLANEIGDVCNQNYMYDGYEMNSVYLNSIGGCAGLTTP